MSAPRPSEADVEALANVFEQHFTPRRRAEHLARAILASDWLAARDAEHEREVAALRVERDWKRIAESHGPCSCDTNPETTSGPEEDCPQHGRRVGEWIERGDLLAARAEAAERALAERDAAIKALADEFDRRHAESDCVCRDYDDPSIWCDNPLRSLLPGDDVAGGAS